MPFPKPLWKPGRGQNEIPKYLLQADTSSLFRVHERIGDYAPIENTTDYTGVYGDVTSARHQDR